MSPCLQLRSGKYRIGFVCIGREPVCIEHNGRRYYFAHTAASGWVRCTKDGDGVDERNTPAAVWDKIAKYKGGES